MADGIKLTRDDLPGNTPLESYIPDAVLKAREPLRMCGPLIVGSTIDAGTHEVRPPGFIHMDQLTFGIPVFEIGNAFGGKAWLYRGTAFFAQGQNIIMPYTVAEFETLMNTWNPAG